MIDQFTAQQMVELLKTNPQQAAQVLASSGLTPEQVFSAGSQGLAPLVSPSVPQGAGILPNDNGSFSAGFQGPVVAPTANSQTFTASALPTPVPYSTDPTLTEGDPMADPQGLSVPTAGAMPPAGAMAVGGPKVVDIAGDNGLNPDASTVTPPAVAGTFDQNKFAQMMAGFGKTALASDQKPIMAGGITSAQKAPEPMKMQGGVQPTSMQALLALLQGGGGQARVPNLGALMRG